jgi:hypothetical protein
MCTTCVHAVAGFGGNVLVVVVEVVLVLDVEVVVLVLDVDVVEVVVAGDEVEVGWASVSGGDEVLELPSEVVVAPGSADWICSLHAASDSSAANPASAGNSACRPSISARSRPTQRRHAASSRRVRAPSSR